MLPLLVPCDYDASARLYSLSSRREPLPHFQLENIPTGTTPFSPMRVHQSLFILDRADPRLRALDSMHF